MFQSVIRFRRNKGSEPVPLETFRVNRMLGKVDEVGCKCRHVLYPV
jgi:hypothetical protein